MNAESKLDLAKRLLSAGHISSGEAEELAGVSDPAIRAQAFFAELASETRKPHFGEHQRSYVTALLLRAQEARLYTPDKEQS